MIYTDPISFGNHRLKREDAKIHRCTCGAWCYGPIACGTCGHVAMGIDGGTAHSRSTTRPDERRTA